MSTTIEKLESVFGVISQGMAALEVVGDAATSILTTVGKDNDAAVMAKTLVYLKTVIAIVDAVGKGLEGTIDPAKIADEIAVLRSTIQANDAAAQAALDAKFPVSLPQ
jgi:hypothetical protein